MENNLEDIKHIRKMMERSSKFLSISGLSGVVAGIAALVGAYFVKQVIDGNLSIVPTKPSFDVFGIAILVLMTAVSGGLYFSMRKAKKLQTKFWTITTKRILFDFGVPMLIGGIFCLILIAQHTTFIVPASLLVFYGLSLINASRHTFGEVRILGLLEIILGVAAGVRPQYGLIFWSIGFGVLHIIYGIVMYYKYDRATKVEA